MNDDQQLPQSFPQDPDPVNDVVAQGSDIQHIFAAQDDPLSPTDDAFSDELGGQPQPVLTDDTQQKSPLDILEEILKKEEQDQAVQEAPATDEPTPEELHQRALLEQQQEALIQEHRQKMMAEAESEEQLKRNQIRDDQMQANQVKNPFEIRQLERKKTY